MVKTCYSIIMKYTSFRYHHQIYSTPNKNNHYSHMHNDYELFFFFDGDVDYVIDGSIYHLNKNDLLFIKPTQYHCLQVLSLQPYEWTHINFSKELLTPSNQETVNRMQKVYHIPSNHAIKMLFDDLKTTEGTFSEEEFLYYKQSALNLILAHLKYFGEEKIQTPNITNNLLQKILQYIDENIEQPLSTTILSEIFFVSPSWITHTMKQYLNISAKQYINQKKILHAQQLLRSGIPAIKAAELCAYNNYATFFRQYKHFIGKEPMDDKPEKTE